MKYIRIFMNIAVALLCFVTAQAETVTYRIVEYNTSTGSFTLAPSGIKPVGSYAIFENEYGATTGNRYNQIPRNRQATLWLEGWDGCTIKGITFSMCSNNKAGTAGIEITMNGNPCYTMRPASFDSEEWFGQWVSKDLHVYVNINKVLPSPFTVTPDAEVGITVKGGTQEGSVYLDAISIEYAPAEGVETESSLAWIYEKVEAKGKIADGDCLIMYRSGDAAGDIDGMANQHYLDGIGISSTTTVDDPFISIFTANANDEHWTLTNQFGQRLCAKGAQHLAWDEGVDTWDITLGYDGATIASTNSNYGTMRYNAPSGNYPRFWNYTSKSLPLPYLYRRVKQQQPVVSTALVIDKYREVVFGQQDTLVIRHQFTPTSVTNRLVHWQSSNEEVATVRSGIVEIHAIGAAIITATCDDGGAQAECELKVVEATDGISSLIVPSLDERYWNVNGQHVIHPDCNGVYIKGKRKVLVR